MLSCEVFRVCLFHVCPFMQYWQSTCCRNGHFEKRTWSAVLCSCGPRLRDLRLPSPFGGTGSNAARLGFPHADELWLLLCWLLSLETDAMAATDAVVASGQALSALLLRSLLLLVLLELPVPEAAPPLACLGSGGCRVQWALAV